MFSVIFEVQPKAEQWKDYLENAKLLRPELTAVEGFISNVRYRSLTRASWILSLSTWRDEKSVVRWRTQVNHHEVQTKGRNELLNDYHLRVGQIVSSITEQRSDLTEVGEGTTVTLIEINKSTDWLVNHTVDEMKQDFGLSLEHEGLISWDIFDAVLESGQFISLLNWRHAADAEAFEKHVKLDDTARIHRVNIIRDYGMHDRREAPQYFPDAP
ncbi:antibiotic biosynthesis monooxygenase family protein [Paenibacillus paeoniae]|uniref:Antibiotic biosynthesis monooxygenase n=1 Tax=Paenibacillus paeoniae TaxID=2292705 RepID=A0A371PKX7_9BACL|nr:antibiotic biosynthesis monooxygenase [Paenibacillus paeoniae]REK76838.1 antibiotic biosynthesis monooxygenase [Paenibacillus paeoniae]